MENQHRKIKGYRELSQEEIDLMNEIKSKGAELGELIEKIRKVHVDQRRVNADNAEETDRINQAEPERWVSIGRTHFQEGLMALTRSIAQPGFF